MRALRDLQRSEFSTLEELRALQEQRLRRLLARVVETSPWYRERLRGGPPPERMTLADLPDLPFLEKEDLQTSFAEISGSGRSMDGAYREFSGGSTGTPVQVMQSPRYLAATLAELERNYMMCNGFRMGQPRAFVWGSDRDQDPRRAHRGGPVADLLTAGRDVLLNQLWLGGLLLDARLDRKIDELRAFRPRLVVGYVSSLLEVSRSLEQPLPGLAAVQSSAETLTDQHRAIIEDAFGARVYNRYGTREVGNLAHECDDHDGLHLLMENNILEVVDGQGRPLDEEGAEGEVVVTTLLNDATPLIRYRLGDLARIGKARCPCGRSSPRLATVLGRASGMIVGPSGRRLHGEFFTHLFYGEPVRRFRVEQETLQNLRVEVMPGEGYTPAVCDRISAAIRANGDAGFVVDWHCVDQIAPSPSGKFQFTTSRLHPDEQSALSATSDQSDRAER